MVVELVLGADENAGVDLEIIKDVRDEGEEPSTDELTEVEGMAVAGVDMLGGM